jgi:hypothetical protein
MWKSKETAKQSKVEQEESKVAVAAKDESKFLTAAAKRRMCSSLNPQLRGKVRQQTGESETTLLVAVDDQAFLL